MAAPRVSAERPEGAEIGWPADVIRLALIVQRGGRMSYGGKPRSPSQVALALSLLAALAAAPAEAARSRRPVAVSQSVARGPLRPLGARLSSPLVRKVARARTEWRRVRTRVTTNRPAKHPDFFTESTAGYVAGARHSWDAMRAHPWITIGGGLGMGVFGAAGAAFGFPGAYIALGLSTAALVGQYAVSLPLIREARGLQRVRRIAGYIVFPTTLYLATLGMGSLVHDAHGIVPSFFAALIYAGDVAPVSVTAWATRNKARSHAAGHHGQSGSATVIQSSSASR